MRPAPLILGLFLLLGGCSAWQGEPQIMVAPDPVIYPAPAQLPRYFPWVGQRGA